MLAGGDPGTIRTLIIVRDGVSDETSRLHTYRIAGCDCDHRITAARRADGARGGSSNAVSQQSEAAWPGTPQLSRQVSRRLYVFAHNDLRISLAVQTVAVIEMCDYLWAGAYTAFPPGVIAANTNFRDGQHSGLTLLLPQLERSSVYNQYDFDVSWRDPVNRNATSTYISAFLCPSSIGGLPQNGVYDLPTTDYVFAKGTRAWLCLDGEKSGMFDVNSRVRTRDVTDGLSTLSRWVKR